MSLRKSEWILVVYFGYTAVLAQVLPVRPPVPAITLGLNAIVIAGFALVAYADSLRHREFLSIVRDWYAPPLILLAYREMGWFAPATHTYQFERTWVLWDKALLNDWGFHAAIEFFGPVLPSVLEISYSLVYALLPFSMAMLYAYRKRERVGPFVVIFALGVLLSYALFPYFPSEPPRTVFPGEDFPSFNTVFRRFNWSMLGGYGIHTSVFPSAHVSGAFAAAFGMIRLLPEHKWVGRFLLVMAVLIATATVYGRYHYTADAVAGLSVAAVAYGIAAAGERRAARKAERVRSLVT